MHNRALHDSLAAFVEEAAWQLAEEVSGGAEVPFELIEQGRASAPLYCYRPLTGRFIGERIGVLPPLPSPPRGAPAPGGPPPSPRPPGAVGTPPPLPPYLLARGRRTPGPGKREQADAVLQCFLTAVWAD